MAGKPIIPLDAGAVRPMAHAILGGGPSPYDLTIVASYLCSGCHKPHLISVASSALAPEGVIGVLTLAVLDVLDTYQIIPDEEHTWRHHG